MGFNAFLDIAIGLALMYLLLSLTGTVINEFISQILKWRARTLQASITQLLDNNTLRHPPRQAARFLIALIAPA